MRPETSRRDFLSLCGILAAAAACSSAKQMRTAASFIADPALDTYRLPLGALIETVLPIGAPGFPLDRATVETRLLKMFPLEDERRFLGFQKTLLYFDQLDLAPHVAAPLLDAERIALDVPHRMPEDEFRAMCQTKIASESRACETFARDHGDAKHFATLNRDGRAAWLHLWGSSEFTIKRDFAHSVRLLIYISAYSADQLWAAIGYEGPLLARPERRT